MVFDGGRDCEDIDEEILLVFDLFVRFARSLGVYNLRYHRDVLYPEITPSNNQSIPLPNVSMKQSLIILISIPLHPPSHIFYDRVGSYLCAFILCDGGYAMRSLIVFLG